MRARRRRTTQLHGDSVRGSPGKFDGSPRCLGGLRGDSPRCLVDSRLHNLMAPHSSHPQRDACSSRRAGSSPKCWRRGAMRTKATAGTSRNKQLWNATAHNEHQNHADSRSERPTDRIDAQRNHAHPALQAGGRGFEPLTAHRTIPGNEPFRRLLLQDVALPGTSNSPLELSNHVRM